MKRFEQKVVLITGASNGIGQATALRFAQEGARVALADLDDQNGVRVVRNIKEMGAEAMFTLTDMGSESDIESCIEKIFSTWGALDCAFNNAGIVGEEAPFHEQTTGNWDKVISINLTGVFLCMHYELPYMIRQKSGVIVNNSSIAGLQGFPNIAPYIASKHAILGLTKTAALEYAKMGIRINSVCPGVIKTDMVMRQTHRDPRIEQQYVAMEPIGRMGEPSEIAEAVVWLCSEQSSFVTGHSLVVDGGITSG